MIQKLWKIILWLLKELNGIIIWSYNTSLSYLPKKTENKDSKKFMYTRVHSSTVHNNQKVEAVQIPLTGEW